MVRHRPFGYLRSVDTIKYADAGLHGWKAKVGEGVADRVSSRTRLSADQVKLVLGAAFFLLSLQYVVKTLVEIARR
jgi:hypothetical protein